jgi:hypothetical protein
MLKKYGNTIRKIGITQLSRVTGLSRNTLYESLENSSYTPKGRIRNKLTLLGDILDTAIVLFPDFDKNITHINAAIGMKSAETILGQSFTNEHVDIEQIHVNYKKLLDKDLKLEENDTTQWMVVTVPKYDLEASLLIKLGLAKHRILVNNIDSSSFLKNIRNSINPPMNTIVLGGPNTGNSKEQGQIWSVYNELTIDWIEEEGNMEKFSNLINELRSLDKNIPTIRYSSTFNIFLISGNIDSNQIIQIIHRSGEMINMLINTNNK